MRRSRIIPLFIGVFAFLSVGWRFSPDGATRTDFGKITLAADKVLIGEIYSGIRIYDSRDLRNLRAVGFIPIEGNLDAAVIDDILYADDYSSLVLFDISDPAHPAALDTIRDVFTTHQRPPSVYNQRVDSYGGNSGCTGSGCGSSTSPVYDARSDGGINSSRGGTAGQSGSMARFAIVDGYLYCIDATNMIVFDIRDVRHPRYIAKTTVGFGIETLFPYRNYLFIGSSTGMFIYDARDVRVPVKVSEFRHARGCDPVVVEGTRAYVTLRSGSRCGPADDGLHVVDISDLSAPSLITTYPMESPAGLAVSGGIVTVCDGANVRILDVRNDAQIMQLSVIDLGNSYDCIVKEGVLYVVAPNGIAIFDVHDPSHPVRLTSISNIG